MLLIRLVGLGLALAHGLPKVLTLFAGTSTFPESVGRLGFPAPEVFAWAAAVAELAGGMGVALGLYTNVSAALAAGPMIVAAFLRHRAHDHLLVLMGARTAAPETLSAWGSPELALVYLLPIVGVGLLGPGRLSLDAVRTGRRVGKR
jgi:putative oxidoreductase